MPAINSNSGAVNALLRFYCALLCSYRAHFNAVTQVIDLTLIYVYILFITALSIVYYLLILARLRNDLYCVQWDIKP